MLGDPEGESDILEIARGSATAADQTKDLVSSGLNVAVDSM